MNDIYTGSTEDIQSLLAYLESVTEFIDALKLQLGITW